MVGPAIWQKAVHRSEIEATRLAGPHHIGRAVVGEEGADGRDHLELFVCRVQVHGRGPPQVRCRRLEIT